MVRLSQIAMKCKISPNSLQDFLIQHGFCLPSINSRVTSSHLELIDEYFQIQIEDSLDFHGQVSQRKCEMLFQHNERLNGKKNLSIRLDKIDEKYPKSKYCKWTQGIEHFKSKLANRNRKLGDRLLNSPIEDDFDYDAAIKRGNREWSELMMDDDFDSEETVMRNIANGDGYLHGF